MATQESASVFDVMEYIRQQLPESTAMERHKLAYYVQGWHATWEGSPLFEGRIEAWAHGPVVREVWVADTYGQDPPIVELEESARRIVDAVLAFYGHFSAPQLRAMTHMEAPWIGARRGLPEGAKSREEIPVGEMRRYFTRKSVLGEPAPSRPPIDYAVPSQDALRLADEEIVRWREALDKLA